MDSPFVLQQSEPAAGCDYQHVIVRALRYGGAHQVAQMRARAGIGRVGAREGQGSRWAPASPRKR